MSTKQVIERLKRELILINKSPPENCSAGPVDDSDLFLWQATIFGAKDGPYEGGIFKLAVKFSNDYPFKAPRCQFLTPIYHPNVDERGAICLDILKENWSPALTVTKLLLSICSLMEDPNPDDPLRVDAADLFLKNKEDYIAKAKQHTLLYASGLLE
jgi:ubiquitin-conjugating enzyme E2 D/E